MKSPIFAPGEWWPRFRAVMTFGLTINNSEHINIRVRKNNVVCMAIVLHRSTTKDASKLPRVLPPAKSTLIIHRIIRRHGCIDF